jgi:queuine tRNA-ribosyltransferase
LLFGEKHLNPLSELKRNASKPYWDNHDDNIVEISEDGVQFISYRDGSKIVLTPENVVAAQKEIGADIILPLDELPAHGISRDALAESVERSHRWETRSLQRHLENVNNQAMYSIVHGGLDVELRRKSIDYLSSLPFDGYAIGGSLGKTRGDLDELLQWMMPLFDQGHRCEKPRHLLGIADEESIRNAVPRGLDTLDSCYPTKLGRRGTLLTKDGLLRIKRGRCKTEHGIPIDKGCKCRTCQQYDRAYLNHLFTTKGNEYVAVMLGTEHNLHFMDELMKELRLDILSNRL